MSVRMRQLALMAACSAFMLLSPWNVAGAESDLEGIEDLFGKDWYGLYMLGQKFGYAVTELGETELQGEKGYRLHVETHLALAMFGTAQELDSIETRIYGPDGGLRQLKFNMPQPMGEPMEYLGEVVDDKFRLTRKVAGQDQVTLVDIPEETLRDALEELAMINEDSKVGDSRVSHVYQPLMDDKKALEAKSVITAVEETLYNGVPTRVFLVETTILPVGIKAVSKITPDGDMLEQQFGGFTMRLETEELAKDSQYVADMTISSAVLTAKPIPNPGSVNKMTVRVKGIKDEALIIKDARQSYLLDVDENDEEEAAAGRASRPQESYLLTVRKDNLDDVRPTTIPMRPERFGSELKPSAFVQSNDPKIVQQAKSIVGAETDAVKVMRMLNRWVYRNLDKQYTGAVSNALDTLATKSGDCTEHSVLFVALARAVGLPAREVSGIVYSEEYGGFFFHQWAEVFVGKWVATDPTFEQPIADATHIKLSEGELLKQVRVTSVIGRLKIEVLDFTHE